MLRLYIIGICILIVAILANAIVIKLGLKSWYDLIELLNTEGLKVVSQIKVLDYLWLLIGYPFILSFGYVIGDKIYSLL